MNDEEDIVLDDYANINEEDDLINEKNNAADIVKKMIFQIMRKIVLKS